MSNIFYENIEDKTRENNAYRKVSYTGKMQFVYMSINPLDDIHKEIHLNHDQFIRVEEGEGNAILNGKTYKLYDGIGLIIPAGVEHQIINTSKDKNLKLYTIYSPPEHKPNTLQENNPDKEYKNKYLKYKNKYLQLKKTMNF
jgi:mannose-6-phosphate isomerase-like protein (cupin superfamily)